MSQEYQDHCNANYGPEDMPAPASRVKLILPCPFCGGRAAIEEVGAGPSVRFSVGCVTDGDESDICMGYQSLTTFNRRSEAIDAWNRRQADELATKWHETCETIMTMAGLSSSGSPKEMLAEFQQRLAERTTERDYHLRMADKLAERIRELEASR